VLRPDKEEPHIVVALMVADGGDEGTPSGVRLRQRTVHVPDERQLTVALGADPSVRDVANQDGGIKRRS